MTLPTTTAESNQTGSPGRRDRVVIQRNPTSGSGRGAQHILTLVRHLKRMRYRVSLFANRDRLDRFVHRPDVAEHIACLVAAGGDGTIACLANRHSQFPIATLPLGTENLVARHLQIPRCGRTVAEIIHQNKVSLFDTAFVNDQRFLLMASAGVDAEVVRRFTAVRKGNISHASYCWPIVTSFTSYAFPEIQVCDVNNKVLATGSHVIITNIPQYGFRIPFCPASDPHDGHLDVRVFRMAGSFATMIHGLRTRLGFSDRRTDVTRFLATEVRLRSKVSNVPVQCDGDPAADCPVTVRIDPKSMKLLVRA